MSSFVPGDCIINSCTVNSSRGSLELTQGFLSGRIYESIFVASNICEIDVFDTDDALGTLPILGDETIFFSFSAPGTPVLNYTFALDKVELVDVTGTQKGKEYILHGVGEVAMQAKANYIQKAYNDTISNIVRDVHTTFLQATTNLLMEATSGIQKIISPNMKPLEFIDLVRRRAVSAQNPSSTYLYFENADGHNFKTIEGMMKSGSVKTFVHGDGVGVSVFTNTWNNIIAYEVPKIVSSTQRIALGSLNQQISTYDQRTRQYSSNSVQLNLGKFNSSAFKAKYGKTPGIFNFLPIDTILKPTQLAQSTPYQMAYLSNLVQCYINLKVNGDTTVKAGDKITINIPQPVTISQAPGLDPLLAGNYLVSRICRDIGRIDQKPRYVDNIEATTDTLGTGAEG